jgi:hypothetical protein
MLTLTAPVACRLLTIEAPLSLKLAPLETVRFCRTVTPELIVHDCPEGTDTFW